MDQIKHIINDEDIASPERFYTPTDVVPDIDYKRMARLPFLEIRDGSYPSPVVTPHPENNTVHVRHFRVLPKKQGRPCVVMINGLNLDSNFYFDWWCWRFAAWGLDSVLINTPYSQKRVPPGSFSGQLIFTPETLWTLMAVRQSFIDTHLLVNRLKAEGAGAIGMMGVSFGALISGIYICQGQNADFGILGMPPVDVVALLSKWDFADKLREREAAGETTMLTDPRVPPLLNLLCMKPKVPRERVFIGKGLYDHLVAADDIDRTGEAWGGLPWLRSYPKGHLNTFVFNLRFIEDARRFIHQEIHCLRSNKSTL